MLTNAALGNQLSRLVSRLNQRAGWLLASLFSIIVVALFWTILPSSFRAAESNDTTTYYLPVALNLLGGQGLTFEGQPATRYPPGYSLMLAGVLGFGAAAQLPATLVLSAFDLICMALATALLYSIACSVWGPNLAWLTVLGWVTYPFTLWLTKQPNVEVPFFLVLYGACAWFWYTLQSPRPTLWSYGLVGVLAGLVMLVRPIAAGLGVVFVIVMWFGQLSMPPRKRIGLGLAMLLGNFMAVLPWQVWLYSQTNEFYILSSGGLPSLRDGLTFTSDAKSYREPLSVPADIEFLMKEFRSEIDARQMESFGQVIGFWSQAFQRQPGAVLKLYAWKAARSWYATDSARYEIFNAGIQSIYGVLALLATLAAWRQRGQAQLLALTIWIIQVYFWIMTISVLSILRYMVPAIGLIFLLMPALVQWVKPYLRRAEPPISRWRSQS